MITLYKQDRQLSGCQQFADPVVSAQKTTSLTDTHYTTHVPITVIVVKTHVGKFDIVSALHYLGACE